MQFVTALHNSKTGCALSLIHTDPVRPRSHDSAAAAVAQSRASFTSRFSSLTGSTFFTDLTALRMHLAAGLLRKSDLSVSQISAQIGYKPDASFNRAFRKDLGQSAASYRRAAETQ